jgi:hypothetical protein
MANYDLGQNGFNWWVGEVVNVYDPHQSGRVQIRVYGRHDNKTAIPDEALPWALPIQPVTSAAHGRIGTAPVGLVKGSRVLGYWADEYYQQPVILGSLGKSGDVIDGKLENGAPSIDVSAGGSIPSSAQLSADGQPLPYNPYSYLSSQRNNIALIDAGAKDVSSVKNNTGSIITADVERNMSIPKAATIGYADPNDTSNVLNLINKVDPGSTISSLPCMPTFMLGALDIGSLITSYANRLIKIAVRAIKNALLQTAKRIGLFKLLYALNETARTISAVANLIDAISSLGCAPNHVNQKNYTDDDIILASVVYDLNQLAGYIHGVTTEISDIVSGRILDSIVLPPISLSVNVAIGPPENLVPAPPSNYIQVYRSPQNDPYPGYIEWKPSVDDGLIPQTPYYTLRNGQPNYSSASQHIFFETQFQFLRNTTNVFKSVGTSFNQKDFAGAINQTATFIRKIAPAVHLGIAIVEDPGLIGAIAASVLLQIVNMINRIIAFIDKIEKLAAGVTALTIGGIFKILKMIKSIFNILKGRFLQSQMKTYKQKVLVKTALKTSIV